MIFDKKINLTPMPDGWLMTECKAMDIWEMERFYRHTSGGLLLDAMGIKNGKMVDDELESQFNNLGFKRKCDSYSLSFQGQLYAVIIVEQSMPALNLSELTNCIKVVITKPELLTWDVLSRAVSRLAVIYNHHEIPVLIYPVEFAKKNNIHCEKEYLLWILNLRDHENDYGEFLSSRFRVKFK
jgi:hypothetical protein